MITSANPGHSQRTAPRLSSGESRPEVAPDSFPTSGNALAELTDDEVADKVTVLAAHLSAATYQFLVLLEELDRRKPWAGFGIASTAHWLSWKCGIDMRAG